MRENSHAFKLVTCIFYKVRYVDLSNNQCECFRDHSSELKTRFMLDVNTLFNSFIADFRIWVHRKKTVEDLSK